MTIDDARKHAARLNASVSDGESPAETRRNARDEMTFSDLFTIYLEQWAKVRKKTWRDDESRYRLHLSPLHHKKLSAITRQDVATIHAKIGKEQSALANRVHSLVSKIFNMATELGLWAGENPAKGIRHFSELQRDRFLSVDEIQQFMVALDAEKPIMRAYFLLSLLTGARRANMMAMRWEEIDRERQVWRIPDTKNKQPVTVPLVPMAMEILHELRQESTVEWVFPSARSATGHLVEPRKAWERLLERAEIENARIHDLRRTMGSWQAITGASLPVIGKSLGHQSQQATAIYARLSLDPVRAAMEKAVDAMTGVKTKG